MPRSNWTQGCQVYGWVHTIRGHRQKAGKVRPLSRHPCRTQWCASSKTPGLTLGLEGERARCGSHTCHRPWPGAWLTGQRCGRTMPGKLVTNSGRRCRYSERAKRGKMCASCDSHQRMTRQRRVLTSKRMEFNNHAMTSFPASSAITHWAQEQSGRGGRDGAYVVFPRRGGGTAAWQRAHSAGSKTSTERLLWHRFLVIGQLLPVAG